MQTCFSLKSNQRSLPWEVGSPLQNAAPLPTAPELALRVCCSLTAGVWAPEEMLGWDGLSGPHRLWGNSQEGAPTACLSLRVHLLWVSQAPTVPRTPEQGLGTNCSFGRRRHSGVCTPPSLRLAGVLALPPFD